MYWKMSLFGADECMRRKNLDDDMIQSLICQALLALLKTKEYKDITVSDIAEEASLHRATFYRHFRSKEEVVRCCLAGILDGTDGRSGSDAEEKNPREWFRGGQEDFYSYIMPIFRSFSKHKQQILMLSRAGLSGELLDVLKDYFHFDGSLRDWPRQEETEKMYRDAFRIGGIYASLLLWISHDMRETPEEMARIATSLNRI